MKFRRDFNSKDSSFSFSLYNPTTHFYVWAVCWEDNGGAVSTGTAEVLARDLFDGLLLPIEVKKAFGYCLLPKGWERVDNHKVKANCLNKKSVIRLTAVVKAWWHKGLENCQALIIKKRLNDWLEKHYTLWSNGEPCL